MRRKRETERGDTHRDRDTEAYREKQTDGERRCRERDRKGE